LRLKGIWVHDQHFGVLLQALKKGNSVRVSALDYPLGALCTLASEAAKGGGKLIISDSDKLPINFPIVNPTSAIVDSGKGHVVLL